MSYSSIIDKPVQTSFIVHIHIINHCTSTTCKQGLLLPFTGSLLTVDVLDNIDAVLKHLLNNLYLHSLMIFGETVC